MLSWWMCFFQGNGRILGSVIEEVGLGDHIFCSGFNSIHV